MTFLATALHDRGYVLGVCHAFLVRRLGSGERTAVDRRCHDGDIFAGQYRVEGVAQLMRGRCGPRAGSAELVVDPAAVAELAARIEDGTLRRACHAESAGAH